MTKEPLGVPAKVRTRRNPAKVIKLGGELLETPQSVARLAREIVRAAESSWVVVVHGGGRTIDAELAVRGVTRRAVDGLRVTDHATLDVVVSVLAGLMNTRLVAAIGAAGGRAVGLTGADAAIGLCEQAPPHCAAGGGVVDLGLVGRPIPAPRPDLLVDLCEKGCIPVVASIGVSEDGQLLNVNADTWAAHLASVLAARQLLIVGATAGVLDAAGSTLDAVDVDLVDDLVSDGRVSAGMVAKLEACRNAWRSGVRDIRIVDGRGPEGFDLAQATRIVAVQGPQTPSPEPHASSLRPEDWKLEAEMNSRIAEIQTADATYVLQTYRRAGVVFERGEGAWLHDVGGEAYLDLISGIGVASLGHAHPGLARALADQASALVHTSNLYHHPLQGALAERLTRTSGLARAFFCNSGTEAVEACLKFARRYWFTRGERSRTAFVALEHAFHGRTFGSLSATWDEHYREPFEPLVPGVVFVSPDDPAALERAVTSSTAAILIEPIQGEGGVRPVSPALVQAIRSARARTGALVIADEVQCGLGRTGRCFHSQALGLEPDLMALGKALGGGMPVGAALVSQDVSAAISAGDHGTTYGGNLLACRAALFFIEELLDRGLLDHVADAGRHLEAGLRRLQRRHTAIQDVRGAGLMRGLQLDRDAGPVVEAALERRLLVNRTSGTVIRLLPPLNIPIPDLDEGLVRLDAALSDAFAETLDAPRSDAVQAR